MSQGLFKRTAPPALLTHEACHELANIDPKGIDHAHGEAHSWLGIAAFHALDVTLWEWDDRGELPQEDTLALTLLTEKYPKMSRLDHAPFCAGNLDLRLDVVLTTAFPSYNLPTNQWLTSRNLRHSQTRLLRGFACLGYGSRCHQKNLKIFCKIPYSGRFLPYVLLKPLG